MASRLALVICRSWTLRSRRALATRLVAGSSGVVLVGLLRESGWASSSGSANSSAAWRREAKPDVAGLLGRVGPGCGGLVGSVRLGLGGWDGEALPEEGREAWMETRFVGTGGSAKVVLPIEAWVEARFRGMGSSTKVALAVRECVNFGRGAASTWAFS